MPDVVEPEILDASDRFEARDANERETDRRDAAKEEIVEGLRQTSEDADQAAALVEVIEECGEVGVEAALTPKDDGLNLVRAGIVALLDYARGGKGRSPLQEEPRRGKKKRRPY